MLNQKRTLQEVPVDLRAFRVSMKYLLEDVRRRGTYDGNLTDLDFVEDVYEVWLADANTYTYLCCSTPSVGADYVSTEVDTSSDCPDEVRDKLWEFFSFPGPDPDFDYFDTRVLENAVAIETTAAEVEDAIEDCYGDHDLARDLLMERAREWLASNGSI